ncbi:hypothetical protein JKF63_02030 [Porcisia hertigi]|uniref:Uncharacterized protein n=1 Tax=Porcisia hertigi TaxID=2761500 RepID=A0A836LCA4_9TRYP|nr:hypothetical protein JKF63_02030 [Porcisia hertigi]
MTTNTHVADDAPQPRVYLKVNRKRGRDDFVEEAMASTHVRVQWDRTEMGSPPPILQPALSSRTKLVFRRLHQINADKLTGMALALERQSARKRLTQPSRSQVERLTVTRECVVIECGVAVSHPDVDPAAVDLFVLDSRATERDAMIEAFGDFAITEDDLTGCTASSLKRGRDDEDGDLPCYFLAPVRRTSGVGDRIINAADSALGPPSRWGVVEADGDGTMWRLLQEYDESLCVEVTGDATADLYCYPDHRKDDEYDSNAEDFSGNDYPDDADDGSGESPRRSDAEASDFVTRHHGRHAVPHNTYGIFCEEGYSERSLSTGWRSDD